MVLEPALAVLFVAGVVAVVLAQARLPRRRDLADDDADSRTLAALARSGADLTRETLVTFHVYFATEEAAEDVAAMLADEGYQSAVRPSPDGSTWLCSLGRRMQPTPEGIRLAAQRVSDVARSLGGVYDGWEAAPAPRGVGA